MERGGHDRDQERACGRWEDPPQSIRLLRPEPRRLLPDDLYVRGPTLDPRRKRGRHTRPSHSYADRTRPNPAWEAEWFLSEWRPSVHHAGVGLTPRLRPDMGTFAVGPGADGGGGSSRIRQHGGCGRGLLQEHLPCGGDRRRHHAPLGGFRRQLLRGRQPAWLAGGSEPPYD